MQGVPPLDREVDDGDVDHPDEEKESPALSARRGSSMAAVRAR